MWSVVILMEIVNISRAWYIFFRQHLCVEFYHAIFTHVFYALSDELML